MLYGIKCIALPKLACGGDPGYGREKLTAGRTL